LDQSFNSSGCSRRIQYGNQHNRARGYILSLGILTQSSSANNRVTTYNPFSFFAVLRTGGFWRPGHLRQLLPSATLQHSGEGDETEHDGRGLRDLASVGPLHALELSPAGAEKADRPVAAAQRRSEILKAWIIQQGIPANRFVMKAYGPVNFVADNSTEEGRDKNRRVEFKVVKTEEGMTGVERGCETARAKGVMPPPVQ